MSITVDSSELLQKITNYEIISNILQTSKGYYNWGKERSTLVAFAESKLENGIHWIAPNIKPILESSTYNSFAKPLLTNLDHVGVSALNSVENGVETLKNNYNNSKEKISQKVGDVRDSTLGVVQNVQNSIILPVDSYLGQSLLTRPYTLALDVAEKVLDTFLPVEKENESDEDEIIEEEEVVVGPIVRTARLTVRAQQQTLAKISGLTSIRNSVYPLQYTLDLVQFAANSLDRGVNSVKETVNKGMETVSNETPKVKDKINNVTIETVTYINNAVNILIKQIPAPISTRVYSATHPNGEINVNLFATVASGSSKILHEVSETLSGYISKGEKIPGQILHATVSKLNNAMENLFPFVKKNDEP